MSSGETAAATAGDFLRFFAHLSQATDGLAPLPLEGVINSRPF
jgi:hypothetical protein